MRRKEKEFRNFTRNTEIASLRLSLLDKVMRKREDIPNDVFKIALEQFVLFENDLMVFTQAYLGFMRKRGRYIKI